MKRAIELTRFDAESVLENRYTQLDSLRDEHVFVSGCTGMLGSWLLELVKVLNETYRFRLRVTSCSRHASAFERNWPHLAKQPGIHLVESDIRYFTEFPSDVRYIIHAAALTDRRLLASQPSTVAEINGFGTLRALRAANLLEDVQKFVLLSSALIYGRQPWDCPQIDESFSGPLPCNQVANVYAESKRFAEAVAQSAISESKLPVVTLRPFAFVGPYQSLQLPWAVTDFIRDSFTGGPIRIMGDGATVRSLMYGSDFAFWVLAALANGRPRETYNVGSPEQVSLASLATMITQSFSPVPEIRTGLGQSGHDKTRLVPDVQRAKRDLDVRLTVPLSQAIQRTITWNRFAHSQ
jgi:nucleoside-diphosphate-sugar epimerase